MLCAGDVAGVLTHLLTVDGHLATGSSVSPILSYFAYEDMFSEIEAVSRRRDCEMTCYVDDMVFTGPGATRGFLYEIIQVAKRYRLWGHKTKIFKAGQPKVITGVAVTMYGLRLPNRRQQAIAAERSVLKTAGTDEERLSIMPSLIGRLFEAAQVDAAWRPQALRISGSMEDLRRRTDRVNYMSHFPAHAGRRRSPWSPADRRPRGLTMLARTCVSIDRLATGGAIVVNLPRPGNLT